MTTLGLGGRARFYIEASTEMGVVSALRWAAEQQLPVLALGGGSNVVVGDAGFGGLVVRIRLHALSFETAADHVDVVVGAGQPWDAVVSSAIGKDLAGIECLSGIPGWTGATPIQNVGAYGQEVSDVIVSVRAFDRASSAVVSLPPESCAFSYRNSRFKREPERWIVLGVRFRLRPHGAPAIAYAELESALSSVATPTLGQTRAAVLELRRRKSMVVDASDPDSRSAGSFFTNPIVDPARADAIVELALQRGWARAPTEVPRYSAAGGKTKLAAGWLIERAGFSKGTRYGAVGISSRHALALVHHGNGTTAELVELAARIRDRVFEVFEVELRPEPMMVGIEFPPLSK